LKLLNQAELDEKKKQYFAENEIQYIHGRLKAKKSMNRKASGSEYDANFNWFVFSEFLGYHLLYQMLGVFSILIFVCLPNGVMIFRNL